MAFGISKRRPEKETEKVLGTEVIFAYQNYHKPETVIQFGESIKEFEMDIKFITAASYNTPEDIKTDDYEFTEPMHIFIDYMMHRLIQFTLPPMSLRNMIWNISKIYVEIFKKFPDQAVVCCSGYEYLHLHKLRVHNDNVISLIIRQKEFEEKT